MARILVVDDSPSLRQMLQIILQNSGHDVMCAEDGKQGIDMATEQQFEMVLSDFNIRLICHGASKHNLCFLVEQSESDNVVQAIHSRLLEA